MLRDDYQVFTIPLDGARGTGNPLCLGRPGSYVFVVDTSDDDAAAHVSFDELSQDTLPLFRNRGYRGTFRRLFIQNDAQAGKWLKVVVSAERGFEVISQIGGGSGSYSAISVMELPKDWVSNSVIAVSDLFGGTILFPTGSLYSATRPGADVVLRNTGAQTCYLGRTGACTTAAGMPLKADESIVFYNFMGREKMCAICGAGLSTTVAVLYTYRLGV